MKRLTRRDSCPAFVQAAILGLFCISCSKDLPFERLAELSVPEQPAPGGFAVQTDDAQGGRVERSPMKTSYEAGELVRVSAIPSPGWEFSGWGGTISGADERTANPLVLHVDKDEWIIPRFAHVPEAEVPPPADPEPLWSIRCDSARGGITEIAPLKSGYETGELVRVAAVPDEGWSFAGWYGTAETDSPDPVLVIQASRDEWIIPRFAEIPAPGVPPEEPRWTVRVDGAEGGIASYEPGCSSYASGDYVKLAAECDEGWRFLGWTGTEESPLNPLIITIVRSEWIVPVFEKIPEPPAPEIIVPVRWKIRVDSRPGGTVSVEPDKSEYEDGEQVRLIAERESGWSFAGWSGTVEKKGGNGAGDDVLLIEARGNEWIIPLFVEDPEMVPDPAPARFSIKIDPAAGGTVECSPGAADFLSGEHVRLIAMPRAGWEFAGWSGTIGGISASGTNNNPYILEVRRNEWIVPIFKRIPEPDPIPEPEPEPLPKLHTLKTESSAGGTVSAVPSKTGYAEGEYVRITATPAAGWRFSGWNGTYAGTEDDIFVRMTDDQWIVAKFAKIPVAAEYTLAAAVSGNGQIVRSPAKSSYAAGETVELTAAPSPGYRFVEWTGDVSGDAENATLAMNANASVSARFEKREWTFIVYMAADNDLEAAAILDINEMEAAATGTMKGDILVLIDRSPAYDSTNGNWSDTRLYKIKRDPAGADTVIRSQRIACPALGITEHQQTELDLALPSTLSLLIDHAKAAFPAANYGLIFWGHGTGWRSAETAGGAPAESMKALAIDDTSGSAMTLAQAGNAVRNKGISAIGMDTCFGGILEVAREFSDCAAWLVASPGVVPSAGWNYAALFTLFGASSLTAEQFASAAVDQFRVQYALTPNTGISAIRLSAISPLSASFNSFMQNAASGIQNKASQNLLRTIALDDSRLYRFASYQTDSYIDIESFTDAILESRSSLFASATIANRAVTQAAGLKSALSAAVPLNWKQGKQAGTHLGVHLIPLLAAGTPKASHEAGYIRGSGAANQSRFVQESTGWVPNKTAAGSLLDTLFYAYFED